MLTCGEFFAGIGGFGLGFERAGMRTLWQVELDPFCRAILAQRFPGAAQHRDIRDCTGDPQRWAEHGGTLLEYVDVACGGFPCQPVSRSGDRLAQDDARWLWPEYARLIGELRPRYIVVENVPGLLDGGLGDVLRDLAALGFDAEWDCLPAAAFGAPHVRDRVWLVAYPAGEHGPASRVLEPGAIRRPPAQPRRLHRHLVAEGRAAAAIGSSSPPDVPVLVHGVPESVAANGAAGNALDPNIAQWIAEQILACEEGRIAA